MTDIQFIKCARECAAYTDPDAYVSDLFLSTIWGDSPEEEVPASRVAELRAVWDAVHRPVREIVSAAGMTQAAFAEHFCIPRRTVEDWCRGVRECPLYTRLMMQRILGLLPEIA
jgi:hypothetical protein